MARKRKAKPKDLETGVPVNGAATLPRIIVDTYSAQLRDGEDQFGDRANKSAFCAILADWRKRVARAGADPLGDIPSEELRKKHASELLATGHYEAAGLIHGVVEAFAQELTSVIVRILRLKAWAGTERIAIGGGFRASRVGEIAIGRAAVQLKLDGVKVDLCPIEENVDEAAMLGALQLVPRWMLAGHDAILAADIGGTNIRCGLVSFAASAKNDGFRKAAVVRSDKWRYAEEKPSRQQAVDHLVQRLGHLATAARGRKLKLAPFIGIGCPGIINEDGSIKSGGQNLPGNWESDNFNLVTELRKALDTINGEKPLILIHNDAVLQGLSQLAAMRDAKRWGILTIGTGLGNARFSALREK
jgi:hypothetical protein